MDNLSKSNSLSVSQFSYLQVMLLFFSLLQLLPWKSLLKNLGWKTRFSGKEHSW